jgi:hypothetical protein
MNHLFQKNLGTAYGVSHNSALQLSGHKSIASAQNMEEVHG